MKAAIISFFLFSCMLVSNAQQGYSCFNSIFIDRPLAHCDSAVLIQHRIPGIKVYYRMLVEDSIPVKFISANGRLHTKTIK